MIAKIAAAGLICALPSLAAAQMRATIDPRGDVTQLSVGGVTYFTDLGVALIAPGWKAVLLNQRDADPSAVHVARSGDTTTYTTTLAGEGVKVKLREVARVTAGRLVLRYELTPDHDVRVGEVLLQGRMPADVHAGKTRYMAAAASLTRGVLPAKVQTDPYVLFAGPADWVGFLGPKDTALRVKPDNVTFQLQDDRKWKMPSFSLLAQTGPGLLRAGKTATLGLTLTAEKPAAMEADMKKLSRKDVASLKMTDDRPLKIESVSLDKHEVAVYSHVEVRADVAATYDNPFDPDDLTVDAVVVQPDGKRIVVPGFYYVPMHLGTSLGAERLTVAGPPDFRVRYTPTRPGHYSLILAVTDRSGHVASRPLDFTAAGDGSPGFVRVAKASPRYFAYDDGRPYFAVGEDMCWANGPRPIAEYTSWLKGLGSAGGNWARLWLDYNEKGLEWMPRPTPKAGTGTYEGLGRYAMDNAWRLDKVVNLASEDGVRVMFCLGTYGEFTTGGYFNEGSWVSNPYNAANGGPCATPQDFWTNPVARKLYKQRLRYLIARWGYSPDLFGWEFWNEVQPSPAVDAWLAEMAAYLHRNDPNNHLVSTTYGSPEDWRSPAIDFTMTHLYGQAGTTADFTPLIEKDAYAARAYDKPYLLAEFGIDWQTGDGRWDPEGTGTNMHNGAWASLAAGSAGTSMLWYWDSYIAPHNLYHILTPVKRFADTIDWARVKFAPIEGIRTRVAPGTRVTYSSITIPATDVWGKTPSDSYTVGQDGQVRGGPVAMTIGSKNRSIPDELYSHLTWHLDMPQAGTVVARLGSVSTAARLQILVDGKMVVDRELKTGPPGEGPWKSSKYLEQYKLWQSDYDEDIPIQVPAGRHTVTFANAEGDWLQIRSLTLPDYRSSRYPDVNALGLSGDGLLVLWVENRQSTWRTQYDGKKPGEIKGLRLQVPVKGDGSWRVEWWDTFSGEVIRQEEVQAKGGALTLVAPDFSRDLAVRAQEG